MAPGKKQADRKDTKKASKKEDDEPTAAPASPGELIGRLKALVLGSCIAKTAPKLQDLLQAPEAKKKAQGGGKARGRGGD
jgi:hypothetical protein